MVKTLSESGIITTREFAEPVLRSLSSVAPVKIRKGKLDIMHKYETDASCHTATVSS